MSYPLHKTGGASGARTVRTENDFWGLDLSAVEPGRPLTRAQDTQNLIWEGDALKMRPGYELSAVFTDRINGIHHYNGEIIVHAGDKLYAMREGKAVFLGLLMDAPSFGVTRRQKVTRRRCISPTKCQWERETLDQDFLFLNDGTHFLFYDGAEIRSIEDGAWGRDCYELFEYGSALEWYATVPIVATGKDPLKGGGDVDPRGDNRLSQFRSESFYLAEDQSASLFRLNCFGKQFNALMPPEVELRDTEGVWRALSDQSIAPESVREDQLVRLKTPVIKGGIAFTVSNDMITGLNSGDCNLAQDGMDNIRITYGVRKDLPASLTGSRVHGLYGADGADDVLFLGGSTESPGEDAFSAPGNFFCFYQTSTELLGSNKTPITGYCRLNDGRLAVLKDDSSGSTVFFRSHAVANVGMTLAGEPYQVDLYPSKTGAMVEGCITPRSVGVAGNEPCFLGRSGLYTVRSVSNELTDLNETVRRSIPVDPLLSAMDPEAIRSVCWKQYYILACGEVVLVTDGRRDGNGQLRFLKWNLHHVVTALGVVNGQLYFGDQAGNLFLFGDGHTDAGLPIHAYWHTPPAETNDGRNLLLRRLCAAVSPDYGARFSVRLYQDRVPLSLPEVAIHRTDFADWDFNDVTFDGSGEARWIPLIRRTVSGSSLAMEFDFSHAGELKLWGIRMTYEKGGRTI